MKFSITDKTRTIFSKKVLENQNNIEQTFGYTKTFNKLMEDIDVSNIDKTQSIEFNYTETLTLPINESTFNSLKNKLEDLFNKELTQDQCFNVLACN